MDCTGLAGIESLFALEVVGSVAGSSWELPQPVIWQPTSAITANSVCERNPAGGTDFIIKGKYRRLEEKIQRAKESLEESLPVDLGKELRIATPATGTPCFFYRRFVQLEG